MIPASRFNKDVSLTELNRRLDSVCIPHLIDETFIALLHDELTSYDGPANAYYWLLYARSAEAALLCAGHYADNCEFRAAGDLLCNPRKIRLVNNQTGEIRTKKRHGAVSEQFKPNDMNAAQFRSTFPSHFLLQTEESSLLPEMASALARSGLFLESYLVSMDERMKRIADTIAFLLAWAIEDSLELHRRLLAATPESKRFIQSGLCRFTPTVFDALGTELSRMEPHYPATSAFFK